MATGRSSPGVDGVLRWGAVGAVLRTAAKTVVPENDSPHDNHGAATAGGTAAQPTGY